MSTAPRLEPVETPCIGVCILDVGGLCTGCFRTRDEIAGWLGMTADERRGLMARLPDRARVMFEND